MIRVKRSRTRTSGPISHYESLFATVPDIDLDAFEPAEEVGNFMIYTSGTTGMPKGTARSTDFMTKDGVMAYLFSSISFFLE
ncbi:hypothetical protein KKA14_07320 [bacterium]|nr:hypothetical protein [bacterium]